MDAHRTEAPTAEALAQLAESRDPDAWRVLIERHGDAMYRAAYRVTRDEHLASDACQEAFLLVRDGARRFVPRGGNPEAAAQGWLVRVATSTALMLMRGTRRRRRREQELHGDVSESRHEPSTEADALAEALNREIAGLPATHREALLLHVYGGLDYAAIAATLGMSPGNARVRVHRALTRLRGRLGRGCAPALSAIGALPIPMPASGPSVWSGLLGAPHGATLPASLLGGGTLNHTGWIAIAAAIILVSFGGTVALAQKGPRHRNAEEGSIAQAVAALPSAVPPRAAPTDRTPAPTRDLGSDDAMAVPILVASHAATPNPAPPASVAPAEPAIVALDPPPSEVVATAGPEAIAPATVPIAAPGASDPPVAASGFADLRANAWLTVQPAYIGGAAGGALNPIGWNNRGVYDPASHRVIVFDRWNVPGVEASSYANALLAFDPAANTVDLLVIGAGAKAGAPVDRQPLGCLALAPERGQVLLSNGLNQAAGGGEATTDTWAFDLKRRSWKKISDLHSSPPNPPYTAPEAMAYDPLEKVAVLFADDYFAGAQTWLLDLARGTWRAVPRDRSCEHVHTAGSAVAYDAKRHRLVVFATMGPNLDPPNPQLWAYTVAKNSWTRLADCPKAAMAPGFDYDSAHDVFLALIGDETWIYDPTADRWTRAASMDRAPNASFQSVTYDQAHDVFVFQGGTWDAPIWSLFRYARSPKPHPR